MKLLAEKFVKKGFKHHLIMREGSVALYKRHSVESSKNHHYEVVIISSHNGIEIDGNYIEPGELYPSTSQWGNMGWTCNTLDQAEVRFKKALKQVAQTAKNKEANSKKKKN
jgi:hypothetical protein